MIIDIPEDFDLKNPERTFVYPRLTRLKSWLRRQSFDSAKAYLKFVPGIYIVSELTCDSRDLGFYNINNVKNLAELEEGHKTNWSKQKGVIEKSDLRPLPDSMIEFMERQHYIKEYDYRQVIESYLNFVGDRSSARILLNESYNISALLGESEQELKSYCMELAFAEKAERANELSKLFDQEIRQTADSLVHGARLDRITPEEIKKNHIEAFELAAKSLLTKAVSLHFINIEFDETPGARAISYAEMLKAESRRLHQRLEKHKREFKRLSGMLLERFIEIEEDTNRKAENIHIVEVPLSECSLSVIRINSVWLPYWSVSATRDGEVRDVQLKAY